MSLCGCDQLFLPLKCLIGKYLERNDFRGEMLCIFVKKLSKHKNPNEEEDHKWLSCFCFCCLLCWHLTELIWIANPALILSDATTDTISPPLAFSPMQRLWLTSEILSFTYGSNIYMSNWLNLNHSLHPPRMSIMRAAELSDSSWTLSLLAFYDAKCFGFLSVAVMKPFGGEP